MVAGVSGLVWGGTKVAAQISNGNYPAIVTNLAEKFGLKPEDVQTVFDDTRKAEVSSRLDEAVTAGDITAEQKTLILAKKTEIETKIQDIKNKALTASERATEMQTLRTDVEKWATDNKIPVQYVMGFGKGGRGEMGMGFGRGEGMHMMGF